MSHNLTLIPGKTETTENLSGEALLRASARNALRLLWQDWHIDDLPASPFSRGFFPFLWRNRHSIPVFADALLVQTNPHFLACTRDEIQLAFHQLHQQLAKLDPLEPAQHHLIETIIHSMLNSYVMFEPNPHQNLHVPRMVETKQGKQWQLCEFKITPIELSARKGAWAPFIPERKRVYSYGLTPTQANTDSILVHKGTGWGTAQGAELQVATDMWPGQTPGEIFFKWGKDQIDNWVDSQKSFTTTGHSLGGSLAYLTAMCADYQDKIQHAYCQSPPGMPHPHYPEDHPYWGQHHRQSINTPTDIYRQPGDVVSKVGFFPKGARCSLYSKTEANASQALRLSFPLDMTAAHARSLPCNVNHRRKSVDLSVEHESAARKKNNYYIYTLGRNIVFYLKILPSFFFFTPLLDFISRHFWQLLLTAALITFFCFFPPSAAILGCFFLPAMSSAFLTALLPALALANALTKITHWLVDTLFGNNKINSRFWARLREQSDAEKALLALYLGANILTFGLLDMVVKGVKTFTIDWYRAVKNERTSVNKIHTQEQLEKACDYENFKRPGLGIKIKLVLSLIVFYTVIIPLKLILYNLPKALFFDLPSYLIGQCRPSPTADEPSVAQNPLSSLSAPTTPKAQREEPARRHSWSAPSSPAKQMAQFGLLGNNEEDAATTDNAIGAMPALAC